MVVYIQSSLGEQTTWGRAAGAHSRAAATRISQKRGYADSETVLRPLTQEKVKATLAFLDIASGNFTPCY